jgi:hypothetical protein
MDKITTAGIYLAKNVSRVHAIDESGAVSQERQDDRKPATASASNAPTSSATSLHFACSAAYRWG